MTFKEIISTRNLIQTNITENKIVIAVEHLDKLMAMSLNGYLKDKYNDILVNFENILKYSFIYPDDPNRKNIYLKLQRSLIQLTDDISQDIIIRNKLTAYASQKQDIKLHLGIDNDNVASFTQNFLFKKEFDELISTVETDKANDRQVYLEEIQKIFNYIWLSDRFTEQDVELLKTLFNSSLSWYDKSILVTAITLSTYRVFDEPKIHLLFDIYEQRDNQVWQRALTGVFLLLQVFDSRLTLYPSILDRVKSISDNKELKRTLKSIIIQFLKSQETEKITKKIQEDILPEMMKYKTELEDKLDLENMLKVTDLDDKNPDWKNMFKDTPGLYDKFEEFSSMQMEGADVFLSAFSMLKGFSFFTRISNWFLPFYRGNEVLQSTFKGIESKVDLNKFEEGLENSHVLCNSDKYSFCLNLKFMPDEQKTMVMELFNMELNAMNELQKNDELINAEMKNRTIITQYLQDLYRFFKLGPNKEEFDDIFKLKFNLKNSIVTGYLLEDSDIQMNSAEFFFEHERYYEAIDMFLHLEGRYDNFELYEKLGYSYQQLHKYDLALKYYKKAELFDKNKSWIFKKIAFCYRKLKDFDNAIEYYKSAEVLEPDNLFIQGNLGHIYMERQDFESALKYYYKIEYLAPDNHKIQRPIAWCSLMLGKIDAAQKYFFKVIAKEGNQDDYLNLAHTYWILGNADDAIENYKLAFEKSKNNKEWLFRAFTMDSPVLKKNGIEEELIFLMLNKILYRQ